MINLLKLDFKRATYDRKFLSVALIGILLSVAHFFMEVFPMIKLYECGSAIFSPFLKWIIYDDFSIYALILFLIFPILASITYSDSYWLDLNTGFAKSVYTRTKKSNYLISRYITNFIIGGISVLIPLIVSLYLLFMTVPAVTPSIFSQTDIAKEMFCNLFYFHPYIYILIYLFMSFMFGGVYASIGLAVSNFCKNRFLVIGIPILSYLSMYIFEIAGLPQLVPAKFLSASQSVLGINITSIVIIFLILFVGSLILYVVGAKSHEFI
ncbi:MAG: hypothetical protein RSD36_16775 [Terrisporobacter sp.]